MSEIRAERSNIPTQETFTQQDNWADRLQQYRQAQHERRKQLIRPESQSAADERQYVGTDFISAVRQIPDNVPLRFHGTHTYDLEEILRTAELSSGADRVGIYTSFDSPGELSVTTPNTLETTIGDYAKARELVAKGATITNAGYIDILDTEVPLGAIFVLMPETQEEAAMGENGKNVMKNTNLKGKKMVRLLVSQEFQPRAMALLENYGYDSSKCLTYRNFPSTVPEVITEVIQNFPYTEDYSSPAPSQEISISI